MTSGWQAGRTPHTSAPGSSVSNAARRTDGKASDDAGCMACAQLSEHHQSLLERPRPWRPSACPDASSQRPVSRGIETQSGWETGKKVCGSGDGGVVGRRGHCLRARASTCSPITLIDWFASQPASTNRRRLKTYLLLRPRAREENARNISSERTTENVATYDKQSQ